MENSPIYLKKEQVKELNRLKQLVRKGIYPKSFVGEGMDGYIFKEKDTIYKLFKTSYDRSLEKNKNVLKAEDKIVENIKNVAKYAKEPHFIYYDSEGTKLTDEEALKRINEKQSNVKKTSLPNIPIYNEFGFMIGFTTKYFSRSISIYNSVVPICMPLKIRLKICENLLKKYKELYESDIFRVDLNLVPIDKYHGSNVLLTNLLNPEIIDLDGHSTIYFEKTNISDLDVNKKYNNVKTNSLTSLSLLFLDIVTGEILDENMSEDDLMELIEYYKKYGFDSNFIDNVLNANVTNYNQVYDNYLRLVRKKIKYLNLSTFSFL